MPLSPGDLLADKYRIERLVGKGGMGEVYLAENTALGRKVAIKVIRVDDDEDAPNPELVARFRGEARAAAAIGHPGIVDVLDLGATEDGTAFIVMEYLEGESLRERLDRSHRLGVADMTRIGGEMLDALAAAHEAGVVHRDLKPENVFLVSRPVAVTKILDFGISKRLRDEDAALTSTGRIMGTPYFMSPEQGRGDRVGAPSDVYSAGAVCYRALSGAMPVPGASVNEVITNLATRPPIPLTQLCPELPRAFADVVDRMIARLPEARPTARDAAAAFRSAAAGGPGLDDAVALTAPRADEPSLGATAPRAKTPSQTGDGATTPRAKTPSQTGVGVGMESTLGATASELAFAPTDPSAGSRTSSRVFVRLALALAAVATAVIAFVLVRPDGSRSPAASIPIDSAPAPLDAAAIETAPLDAAPPPIDATAPPIDASTDAKAVRRRPDAGSSPNLDDIKEQSPFGRGHSPTSQ